MVPIDRAFYYDIVRIRDAQERLADIEHARYLRERLQDRALPTAAREAIQKALKSLDIQLLP